MGTCPKCKLRIRRNGNHIKLGRTWFHKSCPPRPAAARPAAGGEGLGARAATAGRARLLDRRPLGPGYRPLGGRRASVFT